MARLRSLPALLLAPSLCAVLLLAGCSAAEEGPGAAAPIPTIDPSATGAVELAGAELTQWGAGDAVVLLVGGRDAAAWAPLAEVLAADGQRVLALTGDVAAAELSAVVTDLAEEDADGALSLVGTGEQGDAVLGLGVEDPDLVAGLAVLSPTSAVGGAGALPTTLVVGEDSAAADVADGIGMAAAASGEVQVYAVPGRATGLRLLRGPRAEAVVSFVADRLTGSATDPLSPVTPSQSDEPLGA
ncbi:hypothetical protein [Nocardioides bruguierae]|uniref:Alpha/beta hydrolase n=1 Tax=Nocardioides bruguierae TaxID=2945102 RepID=A0A9X2D739_9ACTN|nr:hypothetical protein [Nocardioides bruguierae]MCM0620012.1 hypothetical protein [Nocardioides bruguierae]